MQETMTQPVAVNNATVKPNDRDRMSPPTIQAAPTCTCGKLLTFDSEIKSWKCLSCNPVDLNAPICATQKCKRPLTFLGPPQNCWRCLVCNPITETRKTERPERTYIDVTVTEKMVAEIIVGRLLKSTKKDGLFKSNELTEIINEHIREIVVDEMANWHIQKPPVTRDEIAETIPSSSAVPKPETYMQYAKRLGVATHKPEGGIRKKADVLADIERLGEETNVLAEAKETEESPEGDVKNPSATVEKGA